MVYVASYWKHRITGYLIQPNGSLVPQASATAHLGAPVIGLALTPDGSRLFATFGPLSKNQVRSFSVAPSGALTPAANSSPIPGVSGLSLPAVSPDGRYLFITSFRADTVTAYSIGKDGGLALLAPPLATGKGPVLPAITPDGRFLYVCNERDNSVSAYTIGTDGRLSPIPGQPFATRSKPHGAAITPDGHRLYLPAATGGVIHGFEIAASGALSPLPGSPYSTDSGTLPGRVLLSSDARLLFIVDVLTTKVRSRVHRLAVGASGGLVPTGQAPMNAGVVFADGPSSVLTPNQGPVAELRLLAKSASAVSFSALGSRDPDGTISRYEWNFGDGLSMVTTTPQIEHTYGSPGNRTVTLTVIDDEGCSTERVFSGQMVSCNGGGQARARLELTVP